MTSKSLNRAIWLVLAMSATALAAGPGGGGSPGTGGGGGGGGGGGKPPVETSNNLAYPIFEIGFTANPVASWTVAPGVIGTNYVYGCAVPEGDFVNTACLNGTVPMTKEACAIHCGYGDDTSQIFRIYKQKVPNQLWKSESIAPTQGTPALVAMIDWGDALESRTSSSTSVVRVEAMPFYSHGALELTGFEMWHVSGTGVDEMWGARTTDDATPLPFKYDAQYAIMHTGLATLHLAKLSSGAATCPATPSLDGSSPYDGKGADQAPILNWTGPGTGWMSTSSLPFQVSMPLSAELNIQGKYVYGYNWMLKNFDAGGVEKAGWWRLTFLSSDLQFTGATEVAIPELPPAVASAMVASEIEPAAETEGRLYVPVVSEQHNLTFIDVCLSAAKGGGGKSRRPPTPGE